MMSEVKVKCFNPGCDINLKLDDPNIAVGSALSLMTNEVIKLMNNRDLKKTLEADLFTPSPGLTIANSEGDKVEDIKF